LQERDFARVLLANAVHAISSLRDEVRSADAECCNENVCDELGPQQLDSTNGP